jgi:gluconolactonase
MSAQATTPGLVVLAETDAHEGPVLLPDERALLFTSVRRETVAIRRLELDNGRVTTLRRDANNANGMTLDREGRLVVCEQGSLTEPARIARLDLRTGEWQVLAEGGLSSPNDVVVALDGSVWFTDPSYGFLQGFRPRPEHPDRVLRLDPATGALDVVSEAFDKPNGLAFSPDERTLYVGDNGAPHELVAIDVATGAHRLVAAADPGHPDGLKVDAAGRILASSARGISLLAPDGRSLGALRLPGAVNFALAEGLVYVTTDSAVVAAELKGVSP